jgi:hypothetical protein
MSLTISYTRDHFRSWLDAELFRRFGRGKSNRSICIEAGLPANALYRVLTKGVQPSAVFIERMATYLKIDRAELERRAGERRVVQVSADGEIDGMDALGNAERDELQQAVRAVLDALGGDVAR